MKTLATCTPKEFITQTVRIKNLVEDWLNVTRIMEIRKTLPELTPVPTGATQEEADAITKRNAEAMKKQSNENLKKMLSAILEKEPDKTIELMALCCFVEPDDANNHKMDEYLSAISELMSNVAVINFFTSVVQLGQIIT